MTRQINEAGLELVKHFEGLYTEAYVCPAGVLTIGYGHTGDVSQGDRITEDEAESLLREDMAGACRDVERLVDVPLNDNQFAALASFAFNCGSGNLSRSTLLKRLNAGDHDCVPEQLARWVKATDPVSGRKVALPGLVRRRNAEGQLWLESPDAATQPQPHLPIAQAVAEIDGVGAADGAEPTIQRVTGAMKRLGYRIFDGNGGSREFDINLFGVRTASQIPGAFDDWLGVFWMNPRGRHWEYHVWPATTDPGLYYLRDPLNVRGTAILQEGQHRSSHRLGRHRGQYDALVQNTELPVYRDSNRNDVLDMNPGEIDVGHHGINIHRANPLRRSIVVDRWSAGCQVLADPGHFAQLMEICRLASEEWGPTFSYTLLTEAQLDSAA